MLHSTGARETCLQGCLSWDFYFCFCLHKIPRRKRSTFTQSINRVNQLQLIIPFWSPWCTILSALPCPQAKVQNYRSSILNSTALSKRQQLLCAAQDYMKPVEAFRGNFQINTPALKESLNNFQMETFGQIVVYPANIINSVSIENIPINISHLFIRKQ